MSELEGAMMQDVSTNRLVAVPGESWAAVCWDYVFVDMSGFEDDIGPSSWIAVGRETKDCEL